MENIIKYLLSLSRTTKQLIAISIDSVTIYLSTFLSIILVVPHNSLNFDSIFFIATFNCIFSILVFWWVGLYKAILRFIGNKTSSSIILGISLSSTLFAVLIINNQNVTSLKSVPVYWCFCLVLYGFSRIYAKSFIFKSLYHIPQQSVVIYGAGSSGMQLCSALSHSSEYKPVAFIDDSTSLHKTFIQGLPVTSLKNLNELIASHNVQTVLLAIAGTSFSTRKSILDRLESFPVQVRTIPAMADIVSGKAAIKEIKDIEIEDILGRDPVSPDKALLTRCIENKTVMVTGAGGSIGSELCRQIVEQNP
ncbi:MAG: polysaccharide biosynthesis protein, partial [Pseudomonadota bacterium]